MKLLSIIITVLLCLQTISSENINDDQGTQEDLFDFFSFFDTNKDNEITYEEFLAYMGSIPEVVEAIPETEGKDWKENVRWAFLVYDDDKNQKIDRNQFEIFEEQMYGLHRNSQEEEIL